MKYVVGDAVLNDDRDLAIACLLQLHPNEHAVTPTHKYLPDWDLYCLELPSGEPIGAVIVDKQEADKEGHIGIFPAYRGKWQVKKTMPDLCALLKVTRTFVPHDTERPNVVCRFLTQHGWQFDGNADAGLHFVRRR